MQQGAEAVAEDRWKVVEEDGNDAAGDGLDVVVTELVGDFTKLTCVFVERFSGEGLAFATAFGGKNLKEVRDVFSEFVLRGFDAADNGFGSVGRHESAIEDAGSAERFGFYAAQRVPRPGVGALILIVSLTSDPFYVAVGG